MKLSLLDWLIDVIHRNFKISGNLYLYVHNFIGAKLFDNPIQSQVAKLKKRTNTQPKQLN